MSTRAKATSHYCAAPHVSGLIILCWRAEGIRVCGVFYGVSCTRTHTLLLRSARALTLPSQCEYARAHLSGSSRRAGAYKYRPGTVFRNGVFSRAPLKSSIHFCARSSRMDVPASTRAGNVCTHTHTIMVIRGGAKLWRVEGTIWVNGRAHCSGS